jgi:glutathionylspermidine synthase
MVIAEPAISKQIASPLAAGDELPPPIFQRIRQTLLLDGCKWDPQVGDVATISPFPLLLDGAEWRRLANLASALAAELEKAEQELISRPDLHHWLGLPRGLRALFRRAANLGVTPAAARVLRFDFHWTTQGWQISEVNSDVPGGFTEASELPVLMAEHYPNASPAGNPGAAWASAIAACVPDGLPVALLSAAGFIEDQQVMAYLARSLAKLGVETCWTLPDDLCWRDGVAYQTSRTDRGPIGVIIRFFQAEWLNARRCAPLFVGGRTPVCNPGFAVLTESKRFPLVWDQLSAKLPTWRRLLPTTVDPRDADWQRDESWLVKSALCNTGDSVAIRSLLTAKQWRLAAGAVRKNPRNWVAQQKFTACPVQTPFGPIYPCIGVYTINGRPAGIYGRYGRTPLIDYAAVDVAVLIADC